MTAHRTAQRRRDTKETQIELEIDLDGRGGAEVDTGIGFYDHMLTAFALNARFDLRVRAKGDLHVSQHHTVEDVGIVLGHAFAEAVGDKRAIRRYGASYVPMDEALVRTVVDLSGRAFVAANHEWRPVLGAKGFDYALTSEFLWGFARAAAVTIHVQQLSGVNNHHICEATFKSLGRALDEATRLDAKLGDALPSTKGSFDG